MHRGIINVRKQQAAIFIIMPEWWGMSVLSFNIFFQIY